MQDLYHQDQFQCHQQLKTNLLPQAIFPSCNSKMEYLWLVGNGMKDFENAFNVKLTILDTNKRRKHWFFSILHAISTLLWYHVMNYKHTWNERQSSSVSQEE
jgi:hypothetical protein